MGKHRGKMMQDEIENSDTTDEDRVVEAPLSFYNNGDNRGNIVQGGQVSGNIFNSPNSPEEVAAATMRYEAERNKFLRAERGIKTDILFFTGIGGPIPFILQFLQFPSSARSTAIGVGLVGVVVNTARLRNVRSKREKLSRQAHLGR